MTAQALKIQEIRDLNKTISNWKIVKNKLVKTFNFKNFVDAFAFMTKIAMISESLNHHPEWSNVYSEVKISLTTHSLNGISNLDFKLAKAIDEIT